MGTLGDIPSDLARWYARRLRYLWTTSVNEGLGFFVIYAVLIFAAALQAQSSLSLRADDEARLDEFLHSDHQVRDEDRYVSALSVVLSALRSNQRVSQGACPEHSEQCNRARSVVYATVQIAQLIASQASVGTSARVQSPASGKGQETDLGISADVATILASNNLPVTGSAAASVAVKRGIAFLRDHDQRQIPEPPSGPKPDATPKAADSILGNATANITDPQRPADVQFETAGPRLEKCEATGGPPGAAEEENRRRQQFSFFEALCETTEVTGLQLPEQIAGLQESIPATHALLTRRLNQAIGISFALDAALRANVRESMQVHDTCSCCTGTTSKDCAKDLETHSLIAAYFISADSILRYWRVESTDPIKSLPKNIRWAAREYFETYERGDTAVGDEYVSQPYIDMAGQGIVQTICRAVTTPQSKSLSAGSPVARGVAQANEITQGDELLIAGIVCADLALRLSAVKELVEYIQGGPLVSAGLVRIQSNGEALIETDSTAANAAELKELKDSAQWSTTFPSGWMAGQSSRGPTRLIENSKIWYVVPIARSGTGLLAVALHPSPSSGVGRLFRWAWLGGTCGAALILLTFTAHQSRRVAIASRDLARLRGLATAVIEVRPDASAPDDFARQIISSGNDRAEEVLQIPLANFGLTDGAKPTLGALFDESTLVAAKPDSLNPAGQLLSAAKIAETRKRGETNTYFARLRTPRIIWQLPPKGRLPEEGRYWWIRVSAGPVILPRWRASSLNPRGRLESTLGIMVPIIDAKLSKELDDIVTNPNSQKS